ncbi:photoreceptor-specific nuclear receptor [Caerostris extrusa]|uniref:Photoreceptor-specific nuclear receptor n=1 Tax=Caerostris extrusa TaxID=172846 RepID=A0AAV4TB98_CAEEX|nr:photoreceptor-specific nuclear receptor [Caerostris extrusa]
MPSPGDSSGGVVEGPVPAEPVPVVGDAGRAGHPASPPLALTRASAAEPHLVDMHYVQEVMRRFRQLSPDATECSCLKAIVLFRPETVGLCDVHPVEMLQDQAQCILGDYVRHKYPRQPTRFGRLLLLIPLPARRQPPGGGEALLQGHHRRHPHREAHRRHVPHGEARVTLSW